MTTVPVSLREALMAALRDELWENLLAALQAKSEAYHAEFITDAGDHFAMAWSNCTAPTCVYDRNLLRAALTRPVSETPEAGASVKDEGAKPGTSGRGCWSSRRAAARRSV